MTNTITDFLPQLAAHPDVQDLVQARFGPDAGAVLQGMTKGRLGGAQTEELEEQLTSFILDHGEEVASYQGLGTAPSSSDEAMRYFEAHQPEAHHLIQAQAKELERLLGKDQAAIALGQKRKPFYIRVLCWGDIYVVMAEEFEEQWFNNQNTAVIFAEKNYKPFIESFREQDKLGNVS